MWLSKEVLCWAPFKSGCNVEDTCWRRAYEIWAHADDLLSLQCTDFELVDSITTLKRAVNHRLKQLNNTYHFKQLFHDTKGKHTLDQLSYFKVIRPLMAKKLLDIRNQLEHEDTKPPGIERCQELLDFVWYFLRSTDKLVARPVEQFELNSHDNNSYGIEFTERDKDNPFKFNVYGWVEARLLYSESVPDSIELVVNKVETREEVLERLSESDVKYDSNYGGRGVNPSDVFFTGSLHCDVETLREIYMVYFSLM